MRDKLSEVITLRLDQLPAPTWKTFIDAAKPINRALAESMCTKKKYRDELGIDLNFYPLSLHEWFYYDLNACRW